MGGIIRWISTSFLIHISSLKKWNVSPCEFFSLSFPMSVVSLVEPPSANECAESLESTVLLILCAWRNIMGCTPHSSMTRHCSRIPQPREVISGELQQPETRAAQGQIRPVGSVILKLSSCNSISSLPYLTHAWYHVFGFSDLYSSWPTVKLQPQLPISSQHFLPPKKNLLEKSLKTFLFLKLGLKLLHFGFLDAITLAGHK